jgi:hypothetical protein
VIISFFLILIGLEIRFGAFLIIAFIAHGEDGSDEFEVDSEVDFRSFGALFMVFDDNGDDSDSDASGLTHC